MAAGTHNIVIEKGATFNPVFTWKDENGAAINLTGYTARMHIREYKDDEDTIIELTSTSGITLGGAAGTIAILIPATATAALTQKAGYYDLELVSGSVVTRLLEGKVTISPEVTR